MASPIIAERTRSIIQEQFGTGCFTYVTSFAELGADSLDPIELIVKLENAFDISITDDECAEADTVAAVIALVERKSAEKTRRPGAEQLPGPETPKSETPADEAAGVSEPAARSESCARGTTPPAPETRS